MDFFQSLTALNVIGNFKIAVGIEQAEQLTVSVLLENKVKDSATKLIPPIILRGTAKEIDEEFFNCITQPVKETAGLFTNMREYLKGVEQAKLNSAMEKDRLSKLDKDKTDKQKKYEEGMKKADELDAEGKPKEAWMKVPDLAQYPEFAEEIRKRKSELSAKFAPDLFNI